MALENQLREMIARILMAPAGGIGAETSLASLHDSLGEAKLRLGLKHLGLKLPAGVRPANFAALCDFLDGKPAQSLRAAPRTESPQMLNSPLQGLSVGLDIQDVAGLPAAADYWEDTFYAATFAKPEIAYAAARPDPRIHFAGFWCAKEALRKCDASFAAVDPAATLVAHEPAGRPFLIWKTNSGEARLRHALSISHSGSIAMAIVVDRGQKI